MTEHRLPRTAAEVAELEASYRPFTPATAWATVHVDEQRWHRHADALREAVERADPARWKETRERFLCAAALDSSALSEMIRPSPQLTTIVLRQSIGEGDWSKVAESTNLVAECHRRALIVASDAAEARRTLTEDLIARLQDLIVEAQSTYTVSIEDGTRIEVDLPKRQYKPVSNYLIHFTDDHDLVPFAPASGVADEMRRLAEEFASDAFAQLHPVVQSAFAHAALTHIHPFADGNGRLARTVASMPLLREVGLPQVIIADQWPAYVTALSRSDSDDVQALADLFLAVHVNTMDLARNLIEADLPLFDALPVLALETAEGTLLDLLLVTLRDLLRVSPEDWRRAVTRSGDERVRVALVDAEGNGRVDTEFVVTSDGDWLRVVSSAGDVLELSREDVTPVPLEIVYLRVQAWLERLLQGRGAAAKLDRARGLFVLGVPRSGTTMMGNYLGSHPDVLGLAEYGGFYAANSVVPTYVNRLPGREHAAFLASVRDAAADAVHNAARTQSSSWFCDATPWNLEVAGTLAQSMPDAIFVLMLRHFSGAVLSLRKFGWAGKTWQDAATLWVSLNARITQLPEARTVVVGYDAFAANPGDVVAEFRGVLASLGLDPEQFDETEFAASHAAIVDHPRPTVATVEEGGIVFHPISSLDVDEWTPEAHAAVWPVVSDMHRALRERFREVYIAPQRPSHVSADEW
jgi:hypothetical protein